MCYDPSKAHPQVNLSEVSFLIEFQLFSSILWRIQFGVCSNNNIFSFIKLLFTATLLLLQKIIIGFVFLEANKRSFIFSVLENTDFILSSLCSIKRTISDGLKGRLCSGAVWKMMESDKVSEELEADKSSSTEGAYHFFS